MSLGPMSSGMAYLPGGQLVHAVTPFVSEYFPAPHSMHEEDPTIDLYLPAVHIAQDSPPGPVNPRLH